MQHNTPIVYKKLYILLTVSLVFTCWSSRLWTLLYSSTSVSTTALKTSNLTLWTCQWLFTIHLTRKLLTWIRNLAGNSIVSTTTKRLLLLLLLLPLLPLLLIPVVTSRIQLYFYTKIQGRCRFISCEMLGPIDLRVVRRLFGDRSSFNYRVK